MAHRIAAVLLLVVTMSTPNLQAGIGGPCVEDGKKFCKDQANSWRKMRECLQGHANELSPACKAKVEGVKEATQALKKECGTAVKQACKDELNPKDYAKCVQKTIKNSPELCGSNLDALKQQFK